MTFVDIFQLFHYGDLRLLSLGNNLSVYVVIATDWQPMFICWSHHCCQIYWLFRSADFMYKSSCSGKLACNTINCYL